MLAGTMCAVSVALVEQDEQGHKYDYSMISMITDMNLGRQANFEVWSMASAWL